MRKYFQLILFSSLLLALSLSTISIASDREMAARNANEAVQKLATTLTNNGQASPEVVKALQDLSNAVRQLTEAVSRQDGKLEEIVQKVSAEEVKEAEEVDARRRGLDGFLDRFSLFGDFRLRYENDSDRDSQPARDRERLRFRLGAEYKIHEDITVGGRLRTGNPDDPKSPHQTLGDDVLDSFEAELDRLYVTYRPTLLKGLWVTAGKFGHPFKTPAVYEELLWDADVNPEGFAAGYKFENLGFLKDILDSIELMGGMYVLDERNLENDVYLPVGQLVLNKALGDFSLTGALGYYSYQLRDKAGATIADNSGNALLTVRGRPVDYISDFQIFDTFLNATYAGFRWPITLMGQYFQNTEADNLDGNEDEDYGFAVGFQLGQTRKQGDWRIFYQYSRIEQESLFSPFSQDDFLLATNFIGNVFGIGYQLLPNTELRLWGLSASRIKTFPGRTTDSDISQFRFRADLNIKF